MSKKSGPRIALLDLETAPLEVFVWGIHGPQFIALNQIIKDWSILSYSLKFLGESKIYYNDNRKKKDPRDDKQLVVELRQLLEGVDIIVTQNGDRFDWKKFQARVAFHKLKRLVKPASFDTYKVGKKEFGFTSHKLEYMCEHLGLKNKKLKSRKFVGMDLWRACLNKDVSAWNEMELYNKRDVFALEDLYQEMAPYGKINFDVYGDNTRPICNCGSHRLQKRGFNHTADGKFQRYQCQDCGAWMSEKGKANNKLPKNKKLLKRL